MKLLTVLALPSTISNIDRVRDSFNNIDSEIVFLQVDSDHNLEVKTPWKFFIYTDEWLSDDLKEALPFFLVHGDEYDFFSVYKLIRNKVDLSPRLFKNNIKMEKIAIYPDELNLKGLPILDGFLLGEYYDRD
jgi:hypothetical protein